MRLKKMGQMSAEMVIEEVAIAMDAGLCPRCMGPLQVVEKKNEVLLSCRSCSWRAGFGGDWR
jgi:hypothetical protein